MIRQRGEGACFAYSKSDGNAYALPRAEYLALKAAWMAGKAFYEGTGIYGSPLVLRLADVVAIVDASADDLAMQRADKAADEREDAIE